MSKRAEKAALEAWPVQLVKTNFDTHEFDENIQAREVYIQGYEQAEKDIIERAAEWLFSNVHDYLYCCVELKAAGIDQDFFADFKEAMEEG